SAACHEQYYDEQETFRHPLSPSLAGVMIFRKCVACHVLDRGGSARGTTFLTSRPKRTWSSPGIWINSTPNRRPSHQRTLASPTRSGDIVSGTSILISR